MQVRAVASVGLLLLASFALGYKGDELQRLLSRLHLRSGAMDGNPTAPPVIAAVPEAKPAAPVAAVKTAPPPAPKEAAVPGFQLPLPQGSAPKAPAAGGYPVAPSNLPGFTPPAGAVSPPGSLTNTLDSVRSTEVTDEVRAQRNTYFDALQKQLAEMRKENPVPPEQNPGPPPAMPPPAPGINPGGPPPVVGGFMQQQTMPGGSNAYPLSGQGGGKTATEDDEGEEIPVDDESTQETAPDDEDG